MKKKKKVFLTNHSKIRFDERTDYPSGITTELATKAFNVGYVFSQFKAPLSDFLKSISYDSGKYVAKIYNNYVYIFNNCNGHRLLTVYAVPEDYLPVEQYLVSMSELGRCVIVLTNKHTSQQVYWNEFGGLTEDIDEALEFTSQIKAINYMNNNLALDNYRDTYDITLF